MIALVNRLLRPFGLALVRPRVEAAKLEALTKSAQRTIANLRAEIERLKARK